MGNTMKVLFIGDTPSRLNTDPNIAFIGSRSWPRLQDWIYRLGLNEEQFLIVNRTHKDFERWVKDSVNLSYKIVALGNEASKALGDVNHYKLPHPSPKNLLTNDEELITMRLDECKLFLEKE